MHFLNIRLLSYWFLLVLYLPLLLPFIYVYHILPYLDLNYSKIILSGILFLLVRSTNWMASKGSLQLSFSHTHYSYANSLYHTQHRVIREQDIYIHTYIIVYIYIYIYIYIWAIFLKLYLCFTFYPSLLVVVELKILTRNLCRLCMSKMYPHARVSAAGAFVTYTSRCIKHSIFTLYHKHNESVVLFLSF